ncbi:MAG: ribonuclease G [Steroidobacteraceae bacterium]|nr:ribonuclease G [Gammaproteobacteria bacterium]
MSAEIFINVAPRETRAALIEGGIVQELFVERASRRGFVGNIYRGKVTRVLPGMQAAFIELGLARTGFLHVNDVVSQETRFDAQSVAAVANSGGPSGVLDGMAPVLQQPAADIRRLLSAGDDVLVQVVKDPLGAKGARLTTFISLPSRYLVFMPHGHGIGISSRIDAEAERERLRHVMQELLSSRSEQDPSISERGGYIVRTAAEGVEAERLASDLAYLDRLWSHVRHRSIAARTIELIHEDLPLAERVLRDELGRTVERVLVDDSDQRVRLEQFMQDFLPEGGPRIELHAAARPIFDLYGIEEEINRALERKVALKSGGYLVIDQTESMTTIDVNTGGFVGHRNLEDTIFRTNLEAAVAIARQLRLRNLGGIIIIDFIDMHDAGHRQQVLAALEQALLADHAQTQLAPFSPLGLLEMTRKRTRESLEHLLCEPCTTCAGHGFIRSVETICQDIFRELLRQGRQFDSQELLVLAHPDVIDRLLGEESTVLAELESGLARPIRLQSEALYDADRFDVVLV